MAAEYVISEIDESNGEILSIWTGCCWWRPTTPQAWKRLGRAERYLGVEEVNRNIRKLRKEKVSKHDIHFLKC